MGPKPSPGESVTYGLLIIGGGAVLIGASAPRWPARWLRRDRGPLCLLPGDSAARYERLGARRLMRRFPEMGAVFGGVSKDEAPDRDDPDSLAAYLVEVRRAEWVHWLSTATWLALPLVQPWWMAGAFLAPTLAVNGTAVVILRYNKVRVYRALSELGAG